MPFGLPFEDGALRGDVRSALDQLDLEPGVAVVALGLRGVVPGELELVIPLELQAHLDGLGCAGEGAGGDEDGAECRAQPAYPAGERTGGTHGSVGSLRGARHSRPEGRSSLAIAQMPQIFPSAA